MRIGVCLVCLRKGLLPFDMCLVCLRNSMGALFTGPLSSFLSLMKEKKAKENQGDDRLLFFRVLNRWNESLLPFGMCLVCLRNSMGTLFFDLSSSFLSLMKEKKAKENQGDDRLLFFWVLDRWNESLLPFGMCLVCLRKSMGILFSDLSSSFLSSRKEKKAKENQGDDRLLFFRVLDRWNESLLPFGRMLDRWNESVLPFGMCLVCLQKSMGTLFFDPSSSFLSLMKEKKAKENQGDDRLLFFRVLDRRNESVLPFGWMLDR